MPLGAVVLEQTHDTAEFAPPQQRAAMRKRVLLIAYHFPPEPAAGALRPSHLSRYLPEFGWDVTVLTKRGNGVADAGGASSAGDAPLTVVTAPDLLGRLAQPRPAAAAPARAAAGGEKSGPVKRAGNWLKEIAKSFVWFPDRAAGWTAAATAQALALTRRQRFDAIISTSPPNSAHVVAYLTALRRGIPWVADYRDLWHGNPYVEKGALRSTLEMKLEAHVRKAAAAITAISDDLAARQARAFGSSHTRTIPQAFDPEEWRGVEALVPSDFTLCFAGTLYEGRRRLDIVLRAIDTLRRAQEPGGLAARVVYYGPDSALVERMAQDAGLTDWVACHGNVERGEVLRALRSSAALLVLLDMGPDTAGELGSKIFEYIGAHRPVIALGPPRSVVKPFIERHNVGWFSSDEAGIADALRAAYDDFLNGRYEPELDGEDAIVDARDVSGRFADVLNEISRPYGPPALYVTS
jgi:glycosyltransferase involved in cell wall biosynthesis